MSARAHSRTCIADRGGCDPATAIRWFVGPDETPWPDWTGRSAFAGRGAWTCSRRECVRRAAETRAFARALRVSLAPFDAETLEARFVERGTRAVLDRIGLAQRAGVVSAGQAASREATRGRVRWLALVADDAGAAGVSRLEVEARTKGCAVLRVRSGAELGAALGRTFVGVAVVQPSVFADDVSRWGRALCALPGSVITGVADGGGEPGGDLPVNGV